MIDKEKVKTATLEMTKNNPDWKEILVGAPGAANLRIALAFYASKNLESMTSPEKDEYREFREQLEAQLTAEELKYLAESFARMGLDTAKDHYFELFYKKPPQEQEEGKKAFEAAFGGGRDEVGGQRSEVKQRSDESSPVSQEAPVSPVDSSETNEANGENVGEEVAR